MKRYLKKNSRKRDDDMGAVINLQSRIQEKTDFENSYSIIDMIINPQKRKETYKLYNDKYEETDDEKEIFASWKNRRMRKDD